MKNDLHLRAETGPLELLIELEQTAFFLKLLFAFFQKSHNKFLTFAGAARERG
jgi:hypothetical protein